MDTRALFLCHPMGPLPNWLIRWMYWRIVGANFASLGRVDCPKTIERRPSYCFCTPVRPHQLRGRMEDGILLLKQSDTVTVVFCGECQRINATSTHPPRFLRPMMRVLNKHEHSKLIRQRQIYCQRMRKLNTLFFIAVLY